MCIRDSINAEYGDLNGFFRIFVGPAILGATGENWKRQQRLLQKAFITGNITSFIPDMIKVVLSKQPVIEDAVKTQKVIDVDAFFKEITSEVVVTTAFASDTTLTAEIRKIFDKFMVQFRWPLWRIPIYRKLTFIPSVRETLDDLKKIRINCETDFE
eukprot:TRINITY_DN4016_c0_g1_i1.p2 TRINITY_DN4016_c0_g1~~TRINITY_DN4016_c0_g1_i1.p2  ORF type:complete len:157 (-),score=46.12 TRINITY_DN4016_c0_g1_i1:543-1013(-)